MSDPKPLRSTFEPSGLAHAEGGWSSVVSVKPGRLVFVSGLLAQDENSEIVGYGDISIQIEQVFSNMQKAIRSAGGDLDDIVRVDVYVIDIRQSDTIHAACPRYFPSKPPVATIVEVTGLAIEGALLQINAIAAFS